MTKFYILYTHKRDCVVFLFLFFIILILSYFYFMSCFFFFSLFCFFPSRFYDFQSILLVSPMTLFSFLFFFHSLLFPRCSTSVTPWTATNVESTSLHSVRYPSAISLSYSAFGSSDEGSGPGQCIWSARIEPIVSRYRQRWSREYSISVRNSPFVKDFPA